MSRGGAGPRPSKLNPSIPPLSPAMSRRFANNSISRSQLGEQARVAQKAAQTGGRPSRRAILPRKGARVAQPNRRGVRIPPEKWYEPTGAGDGKYRIVTQEAGVGYRHVVTPDDIRERLSRLPAWMTRSLEVVQLSKITRKKKTFPCYGMQWGNALYLYPIESSRIEQFVSSPSPRHKNETRLYGAVWSQASDGRWICTWSEESIRDFYLNNILIHELGHLVDERNTSYLDRERYAEWFAIEYGYLPTQRERLARLAAEKLARSIQAAEGMLE